MRPLRVLSLDFDYFQKVDLLTLKTCYPAGVDLDTEKSNRVWFKSYAPALGRKILFNVEINREALSKVEDIVKNNVKVGALGVENQKAISMIAQSHVDAYYFIQEHYKKDLYDGIELYNVDMHHDVLNDNEQIDCGNWIGHLFSEQKNVKLCWIYNPVSALTYKFGGTFDNFATEDLSKLNGLYFDLIFLCRSDNWVPPHLDNSFIELAKIIRKSSKRCFSIPSMYHSRWDNEMFDSFRKELENEKEKTGKCAESAGA